MSFTVALSIGLKPFTFTTLIQFLGLIIFFPQFIQIDHLFINKMGTAFHVNDTAQSYQVVLL
jgi:hypothetical protein